MISVMNDFEIDRNTGFFGIEEPKPHPVELNGPPPLESDDIEESRVRIPEPPVEIAPDMNGFATGDMVWGKVKSHPWWPGHIYNESFASPSVRRTKSEGFVLVAFFGDSSYGWFDPVELIPYEPNFAEKSKQTTSRSFVKAVEESIDESSRRAALGLSCRCRNPYNFRPTKDRDYFEVDVVGYERNGIYSRRQINKERNAFEGMSVVDFVKELAVTPKGSGMRDVAWHRKVAVALAVRSRRYEEFDETYAQAFGQEPVRPKRDEMGVPQQSESFTPRVAPLSGPLVFAEALGVKKKKHSIPKQHSVSARKDKEKEKDKSSKKKNKKDNYVLKPRRDDHSSFPLPDASFITSSDSAPADNSDYVLQKREPVDGIKPDLSSPSDVDQKPDLDSPQTPPIPSHSDDNLIDEKPTSLPVPMDSAAKIKKEKKVKKRSLEDVNDQETKMKTKKKKKKKRLEDVLPENSIAYSRPLSPPSLDSSLLDKVELPAVFVDLKSLALDPFYDEERNAPVIARHVFLRFRSLVYSKSLVLPAPDDANAQGLELHASKPAASAIPKEAKERQKDQGSSLKPPKLMKRLDDPTNAGKKRPPSDRQEEISAKRMKKVSMLKSLASEKRAALLKKSSSSEGSKGQAIAEPAPKRPEKQEPLLPTPPKRASPTYLAMKFPRGSTLPSVANLKARFARFGTLEVDSTRVFWRSHSCRVLFKYKPDALKAFNYVSNNDVFGQIQVEYSLREVEAPVPEPQPEPPQFRPGNGGRSSLSSSRQQPQGKLKSILKKPGDEAGKENQRSVKFMLSGNDNGDNGRRDSPPSSTAGGISFSDIVPPQPPMPKSTSFQMPPPPAPPQPHQTVMHPLQQPSQSSLVPPPRSYEPHRFLPIQSPRPVENRDPPMQLSEAQRQRQIIQQYGSEEEGVRTTKNDDVDISHQMLSLLVQCKDIVSSLGALPGFVPYRPL